MTKRTFWSLITLAVIIVVIAVFVVLSNLNRIVKSAVEIYGPKITKVSVTVADVHISLPTASATIKGLVVGNPNGYKTPQAVSIGTVSAAVYPLSILSDKIVVRSLKIESPEITFEGGLSGNNLSTILDNVNDTKRAGGPAVANAAGKPQQGKKLEVDDLVITGAKVHASLTGLGGREISLTLPDIHFTNLGVGPNGITATDLTQRIFQAITTATIKAVTAEVTNLGSGAENLGKQGVGGVRKALGNLFGK